jgi:hypothetical protein
MATQLPTGQSERQLMLDRQSAGSCRQLSQAQLALEALVGGEPSFRAGHRLLQAQARKSCTGSPVASTSLADSLHLASPLLTISI